MPPRIRGSSCQPQLLLNCIEPVPASSLSSSAALGPLRRPTTSSAARCSQPFSTTPAPQVTALRRKFKEWCEAKQQLREPQRGQTNYVSQFIPVSESGMTKPDMPFPANKHFRSERVLSEKAREMIWRDVMVNGMPLKAVSAQYSVDMRRVAAVVRMKEIEKKWEREVSCIFRLLSLSRSFPFASVMICNKNSISLEDSTVVKKCSMSDEANSFPHRLFTRWLCPEALLRIFRPKLN